MKHARILVPTDFSELSLLAVKEAAKLAKQVKGTVCVFHASMHTHELDGFHYLGPGHSDTGLKEVYQALEKKLVETAESLIAKEFRGQCLVQMGHPARLICEIAADYDLVVMSSHGRTGFTRLILGSVCEKVLRSCETPVLILKEKSSLFPVNRILLTTDFSDNSVYAFQPAADLAEITGAHIDLVHVVSHEPLISKDKGQYSGEDIAQKLENMADTYLGDLRAQVHTNWHSCKRSVHEEIAAIANSGDYQLVVMATIGRTGLKYLMLGSTSSSVLRHANIPVLSIKPRNRVE